MEVTATDVLNSLFNPSETVCFRVFEDRKDGVRLSDFESALIGRLMVLRSRGEFVTPDALLTALDHNSEEEE